MIYLDFLRLNKVAHRNNYQIQNYLHNIFKIILFNLIFE